MSDKPKKRKREDAKESAEQEKQVSASGANDEVKHIHLVSLALGESLGNSASKGLYSVFLSQAPQDVHRAARLQWKASRACALVMKLHHSLHLRATG